jgi:hypothetical protein
MNGNGQPLANGTAAHVLRWPGRVLAAEDLRRNLNGHRELILEPRAVITPLAAEELRHSGIRITRRPSDSQPAPRPVWGYTQERPLPLVQSAVQALQRDGLALRELPSGCEGESCRWARAVADCVARGECQGGVIFCQDPGLIAVEMPGRTFFEVRQILRTLCTCAGPACPEGVACTLKELDGHAHR